MPLDLGTGTPALGPKLHAVLCFELPPLQCTPMMPGIKQACSGTKVGALSLDNNLCESCSHFSPVELFLIFSQECGVN